jgi:hypothetical protein
MADIDPHPYTFVWRSYGECDGIRAPRGCWEEERSAPAAPPAIIRRFLTSDRITQSASARAGTRRVGRLSAAPARANAPYRTELLWETLRKR